MSAKGSQQESQQQSTQQSLTDSNNASIAQGDSAASGTASGSTSISGDQLPFLQNLWKQATGANAASTAGADIAGAADVNSGFLQQAMQTLGGLGDPSAQIQQQTSALSSGLGKLFREEMLPAIAGNAISAGGFGGGRQGVAQGGAAGNIADAFVQGSADITGAANNQAIQAQSMMPGLAQSFLGNAQGGAMGAFQPLQALAGILGGPAMESINNSSNTSTSSNRALSVGNSRSRSEGQSSGSGSGQSFGVGFGGLFGG